MEMKLVRCMAPNENNNNNNNKAFKSQTSWNMLMGPNERQSKITQPEAHPSSAP